MNERFIDSSAGLDSLLKDLAATGATRCGIDTEADSLHSYREKLCLIQMICDDTLAIIDPLALDSSALQQLLEFIGEREIWMHGADFDMTLMLKTFGFVPDRILDTQLAARLTGHEKFGLANLIEGHFGVSLSKSSQKADWGARPLKEKLLRYAFDDVRYLMRLADNLVDQLNERGRLSWFEEWCGWARQSVLDRPERNVDDIWRVNGWGNLNRQGLAYLREIWRWRDEESQTRDCPPFRVMNNQQMLAVADSASTGKEIRGTKGLRPGPMRRFQDAIERAGKISQEDWPQRLQRRGGPREEVDSSEYERLRDVRNRRAEEGDLDPTIIATRGTLESLSVNPDLAKTRLMKWQRELLFGEDD
ncbi:MAG: ribonuclease D [Verrucomicrobiales bacterium]|jgi:ribonuclease D